MYKVEVSPSANSVLEEYTFRCSRLKYLPSKYRVIPFWPHLWLVFQVREGDACVKIEYIIDDRQNYGSFLR